MDILDMNDFTQGGIIAESAFFEKIDNFNWEMFRDKRVLIKGCGTTIIPPWAFMVVASRLTGLARSIRYGNEHSSVKIYRRVCEESVDVK